jgi:hypothetical protein
MTIVIIYQMKIKFRKIMDIQIMKNKKMRQKNIIQIMRKMILVYINRDHITFFMNYLNIFWLINIKIISTLI